jgi:hypothetical protein
VFDVGGQRNERRKWIHCFDKVNSVIFIIAISEFDQVLLEDNTTVSTPSVCVEYGADGVVQNRLVEAVNLYTTTINSPWFAKASMILFLNKRDLFAIKLAAGKSISVVFTDYKGKQKEASCFDWNNEHL